MNNVILMGRIATDIVSRTLESGKHLIMFTIAVPRKYSKDTTDFINCVAWEKTAEFISKYFRKGALILIDGSIQTRSFEDNSGKKQYRVEVNAQNAYFTGEKAAGELKNNSEGDYMPETENGSKSLLDGFQEVDEEDLPF